MKIYTAAISPAGLACAGEVGDGVLPLIMDPERDDLVEPHVKKGMARAGKAQDFSQFDIAPFVPVHIGDDLARCRQPVKEFLALYVGGMGARGKNFYNDYVSRMGFEAEAAKIQDLFLAGRKKEAEAAVPDKLVDTIALVGSPARIRERLQVWKEAGKRGSVGTLIVAKSDLAGVRLVAESVL
jgi:alkanesulfonate monooxygenase SsuD/methylene tetrahydromethanopterin reductase-like flavin-dependent oxidoreductase (luciferase family)